MFETKMRIITRRRLREFWEIDNQSHAPLDDWYRKVKKLTVASLVDLHNTFPHADLVGKCLVFNVGGNKYRLITKFDFLRQIVYIKHILTHNEYSKDKWKADC